MKYYNIQNEDVWTEEDMREAYDSYVVNDGKDSYEEWLDNMLDQDFFAFLDLSESSFITF